MKNCRNGFPGIFRISCRFIPAHSCHRVVCLAFGVIPKLPGRRPPPPGLVQEFRHRFFPGKRATVFDKRLLPVTPLLVSAGIDELLELFVRHFIPIHPVVRELDWRDMEEALEVELCAPAWNPNHPFVDASIHYQR